MNTSDISVFLRYGECLFVDTTSSQHDASKHLSLEGRAPAWFLSQHCNSFPPPQIAAPHNAVLPMLNGYQSGFPSFAFCASHTSPSNQHLQHNNNHTNSFCATAPGATNGRVCSPSHQQTQQHHSDPFCCNSNTMCHGAGQHALSCAKGPSVIVSNNSNHCGAGGGYSSVRQLSFADSHFSGAGMTDASFAASCLTNNHSLAISHTHSNTRVYRQFSNDEGAKHQSGGGGVTFTTSDTRSNNGHHQHSSANMSLHKRLAADTSLLDENPQSSMHWWTVAAASSQNFMSTPTNSNPNFPNQHHLSQPRRPRTRGFCVAERPFAAPKVSPLISWYDQEVHVFVGDSDRVDDCRQRVWGLMCLDGSKDQKLPNAKAFRWVLEVVSGDRMQARPPSTAQWSSLTLKEVMSGSRTEYLLPNRPRNGRTVFQQQVTSSNSTNTNTATATEQPATPTLPASHLPPLLPRSPSRPHHHRGSIDQHLLQDANETVSPTPFLNNGLNATPLEGVAMTMGAAVGKHSPSPSCSPSPAAAGGAMCNSATPNAANIKADSANNRSINHNAMAAGSNHATTTNGSGGGTESSSATRSRGTVVLPQRSSGGAAGKADGGDAASIAHHHAEQMMSISSEAPREIMAQFGEASGAMGRGGREAVGASPPATHLPAAPSGNDLFISSTNLPSTDNDVPLRRNGSASASAVDSSISCHRDSMALLSSSDKASGGGGSSHHIGVSNAPAPTATPPQAVKHVRVNSIHSTVSCSDTAASTPAMTIAASGVGVHNGPLKPAAGTTVANTAATTAKPLTRHSVPTAEELQQPDGYESLVRMFCSRVNEASRTARDYASVTRNDSLSGAIVLFTRFLQATAESIAKGFVEKGCCSSYFPAPLFPTSSSPFPPLHPSQHEDGSTLSANENSLLPDADFTWINNDTIPLPESLRTLRQYDFNFGCALEACLQIVKIQYDSIRPPGVANPRHAPAASASSRQQQPDPHHQLLASYRAHILATLQYDVVVVAPQVYLEALEWSVAACPPRPFPLKEVAETLKKVQESAKEGVAALVVYGGGEREKSVGGATMPFDGCCSESSATGTNPPSVGCSSLSTASQMSQQLSRTQSAGNNNNMSNSNNASGGGDAPLAAAAATNVPSPASSFRRTVSHSHHSRAANAVSVPPTMRFVEEEGEGGQDEEIETSQRGTLFGDDGALSVPLVPAHMLPFPTVASAFAEDDGSWHDMSGYECPREVVLRMMGLKIDATATDSITAADGSSVSRRAASLGGRTPFAFLRAEVYVAIDILMQHSACLSASQHITWVSGSALIATVFRLFPTLFTPAVIDAYLHNLECRYGEHVARCVNVAYTVLCHVYGVAK